jgi:hypothetical protein
MLRNTWFLSVITANLTTEDVEIVSGWHFQRARCINQKYGKLLGNKSKNGYREKQRRLGKLPLVAQEIKTH